jgi:hypothetical protein
MRALIVICLLFQGATTDHSHESTREMLKFMALDPKTGVGMLSDANVALLFLRYRREFSLLESEGHLLTNHYHAFSLNVKKLAKYIMNQAAGRSGPWEWDQPVDRGMILGLTEQAHISTEEWIGMFSSGRRHIEIIIDERQPRSNLLPASPIDLRTAGTVPIYVSDIS